MNEGLYPFESISWSWTYIVDPSSKNAEELLSGVTAAMTRTKHNSLFLPAYGLESDRGADSLHFTNGIPLEITSVPGMQADVVDAWPVPPSRFC
jgi:hypothetical protein